MKIQGLNRDDFEWIDRTFRYFMSVKANQIKEATWDGSPEMVRDNIESLEEVLKTYEKIANEMRKYDN